MSFYQIDEFPKNSIHGKIIASEREKEDCIKRFNSLKQEKIKDGSFENDVDLQKFTTKTHVYSFGYRGF